MSPTTGPDLNIPLSPNGMFGVSDLESIADDRKTEPMKTRVANTGPRIIPLCPNGMFGVPDLESMAAKQIP